MKADSDTIDPRDGLSRALLKRLDRPGPRYTSYPTAVEFHTDFTEADYRAHLARLGTLGEPIALYLHLPFCEQRCTYCACNVVISPRHERATPYLGWLDREIELVTSAIGPRQRVVQLHIGGGTPTYFSPTQLRALMAKVRAHVDLDPDAELSIEVDPRVTSREHLQALYDEGFRRLSVGVQDVDPGVQQAIGRLQTVEETRDIIDAARQIGFGSVNIDLIYGLPRQTLETMERTLDVVGDLAPDRLAVYGFAYVPWMKSHQKKMPVDEMPDAELRVALRRLVQRRLVEQGHVEIGMDHFARPDDTLAVAASEGRLSRNFMGYTDNPAPHMVGLGITSIGYVAGAYVQSVKKLSTYQAALAAGRLPIERGFSLDPDDLLRADVIRDLMCNFTVDVRAIEDAHHIDFAETFAYELDELSDYRSEGLIEVTPERLTAVGAGRHFVRNLAMVFDVHTRRRIGERRFSQTA